MSGADNYQKVPLARSLNQFAERKVRGAMALLGSVLPAEVVSVSNSIVTVKFLIANTTGSPYTLPNVTIPVAGPEYVRMPTQAGDKGVVIPSDVYLGGVSGLGGGTADLSLQANLSSLIFLPIGNKNFSATDDPNSTVIYGPDGVILRDMGKKTTFTLTSSGIVINLQAGDAVTINGTLIVSENLQLGGSIESQSGGIYGGNIATSGGVTAGAGGPDSVDLQTHEHPTAEPGSPSPPTPGT
jgi:hypothetical protein